MKIYNNDDTLLLDIAVDDTSYRHRSIMNAHNITLRYSLAEHKEIPVGAYIDYQGERYTLERPESFKMKHSREFEYTIIFEAEEAKTKKYKFRNPIDGRLKFSLTATPREHLQMFVDNMNSRDGGWSIGTCIDSSEVLINYNHNYCYEALGMLATECKSEFEFVGKAVSLRKVEYNKNNPLALSYGYGNGFKSGVSRSNSGDKQPIEVLYVQGGSENIDRSTYGSGELHLPIGQTIKYDGEFFEGEAGYNEDNARSYIVDDKGLSIRRADKALSSKQEDSFDATEVYPKRVGEVTGAVVVNTDNYFYDIVDSTIPESLDFSKCLIAGNPLSIIFQSGMLVGRKFEVNYYHSATGDKQAKRFELVPIEEDGLDMPSGVYIPAVGDKYAVFNCALPDAYISDNTTKTGAEWEAFKLAVKHLYENEDVAFTFSGELDGIWAKKDWNNIGGKIVIGGYISFTDASFQPTPVLVRIVGIKDYINNPHSPIIELSNQTISVGFSSTLAELKGTEVIAEEYHRDSIDYTKRRFRDAKETMTALENAMQDNFNNFSESINPIAVQTMQILLGDESLQFRFVNSKTNPVRIAHSIIYDASKKQLTAAAGILQHLTIGISSISSNHAVSEYKFWDILKYTSAVLDVAEKQYYLYAKVSKTATAGVFLLSETSKKMDAGDGYYYLLVGILNKEYEGERSFVPLYGFTEILPARITTDKIISADGDSFFDMESNQFKLGDELSYVNKKLTLKGTLVQSESGDVAPIGCYRGKYTAGVTYYKGDEVTYTNTDNTTSTYRCKSESAITNVLPTDTTKWEVISQGVAGASGDSGKGVKSIVEEYYLSTSKTTQSGGSWSTTAPAWEYGKYMWSRSKITYTDNSVVYTSAICDSSWEAVDNVSIGGRNLVLDSRDYHLDRTDFSSNTKIGKDRFTVLGKGNFNNYKFVELTDTVKAGDTLTMGFDIKVGGSYYHTSEMVFNVREKGTQNILASEKIQIPNKYDWIRYSITITLPATLPANIAFLVRFSGNNEQDAAGIILMYKNLKIEKGNKMTDWSPAPEELIKGVDVMYYLSTSKTELAGGTWTTTAPEWAEGKYMWSKTVTTYSDGTIKESNPTCIAGATGQQGDKGDKGDSGKGVKSIVEEYYLSTSKTTQSGGSWSTTAPAWEYGKYMWSRSKITYTDNSVVYTSAICDSSWEAVDNVSIGGRNLVLDSRDYHLDRTDFSSNTKIGKDRFTVLGKGNFNNYKFVELTDTVKAGDTLTMGFDIKVGGSYYHTSEMVFNVREKGTQNILASEKIQIPNKYDWIRYSITITLPATLPANIAFLVGFSGNNEQDAAGIILMYKNLKIEKGNKMTDWSPAPEELIKGVDVMYYLSTSKTELAGGTWTTTAPEWAEGKYMWSKTVTTYSDGTIKESAPTCIAGATGQQGNYTEYRYAKNGSTSTAPAVTNVAEPSGWSVTTPAVGQAEFLWMIQAVKTASGALVGSWSTPVRLTGRNGSSPVCVYRGEYKVRTTYYGNENRLDVVRYNSQFYIARIDAGTVKGIVPTNTRKWNTFGAQFESVATNLLLAENASIGDWFISGGKIVSTLGTGDKIELDAGNNLIKITSAKSGGDYSLENLGSVITLDAKNGYIEARSTDGRTTSYLSPTGIMANRAGLKCMDITTGLDWRAAIVGYGIANLDKDNIIPYRNLVCGVYGSALNSGTAEAFGGIFNELLAYGLFGKFRQITGNCTLYNNDVLTVSTTSATVTLPPLKMGQIIIHYQRTGTTRFSASTAIIYANSSSPATTQEVGVNRLAIIFCTGSAWQIIRINTTA